MARIEAKVGTTRRDALKTGGGLALALLGLGAGTRPAIFAQGTPAADPGGAGPDLEGRYAVIRLREFAAGQDAASALGLIRDGFVPLIEEIPGFAAYFAVVDPASSRSAYVGVFADKGGADESNERAAAWLAENGYAFFTGEPDIAEGRIAIAAGNLADLTPVDPATPAATAAATPAALAGPYATIRLRKLKPDAVAEELAALVRDGFLPLLEAIPGFAAYLSIADPDTRDQVGFNVFADKAGADESSRVAAEWGPQGAAEYVEGDPAVAEGVVAIAVVAATT